MDFLSFGRYHYTLGYSRQFGADATLTAALELQYGNQVTYTNPALPFGANARERSNFPAFHLMWSTRW